MSLTPQDVEKIANLARLELTPAEKAQYLESELEAKTFSLGAIYMFLPIPICNFLTSQA